MKSQSKIRTMAAVAAVASAMVLGATAAVAQPGPGMHGHGHGHGQGGDMIGPLIAHAKAQLNMNTMQQGLFDTAVAESKKAHESARASHQKVKDALQAEIASTSSTGPNLRTVAAIADSASNDALTLRNQVREKWLQLYDTFTSDQRAVVRTLLQNRMARAESFRQKMMERMHGSGSAKGS